MPASAGSGFDDPFDGQIIRKMASNFARMRRALLLGSLGGELSLGLLFGGIRACPVTMP
jgi:hypothetical protein